MRIDPITLPLIGWDVYMKNTKAALGRSVTRSLDAAALAPGSYLSFIQTLGEFQQPKTAPVTYLQTEDSLQAMEHLYFSFLFDLEDPAPMHLLKFGHIKVFFSTDNNHVFIGSASLRAWREVIVTGLHITESTATRKILMGLLDVFSVIGLSSVFSRMKRTMQDDGTITITGVTHV